MTSATVSPRPAARRIPSVPLIVLPVLSLLATAAMVADMAGSAIAVPLLPGAVWAAGLFVVAAVVAAAGRRRGQARFAVEPFTMALMVVLAALHGRDGAASGAASGVAVTASSDPHAAHLGGSWLLLVIAVAVAALTVVCLTCAVRLAATHGIVAALLPVVSAVAMCAMTTWMLVA
ncbi:hypothetical protein [Leifsonia sp. PS1209]|uniref:hypothetical protein n=1 Tax=Leifsonia sp. PS1209 TaxID=2724914 RepID=UPI001442A416|nr:hypothetical protein [Leifsonia sp. PS1209]QIZ98172.1 hypothetical protein HF024_06360 [Leifsonia sp. PS1209]